MSSDGTERWLWVWYTPFGLGGVETFLLQMARSCAERGIDVSIAGIQSFDGPLRPALEAIGVRLLDWSAFYPAYMAQTAAAAIQQRIRDDLTAFRPTAL